ncbi:type II toxin-antitoxin system RelE/ParE family toxin [Belnapia sp. T6]|uniref:Type II toxin-antitoxin system RelE/ParE family toxin n=1 Tax=Belnapia mucosa TaxID=2804532 RepID=A0ABS1V8T2_9PROT|nr:type II toxin-antitoxin system RelE/ParE family toxin [Belnapia mucosa]
MPWRPWSASAPPRNEPAGPVLAHRFRDLREVVAWTERERPGVARALALAVRQAAIRIGDHPGIGAATPGLPSAADRLLPILRWPYVIIYRIGAGRPVIPRVLHGARDLPAVLRRPGEPGDYP